MFWQAASHVTSRPACCASLALPSDCPRRAPSYTHDAAPDAPRPPQGWMSLHFAAHGGHIEAIKALAGLGAAVDARDVSVFAAAGGWGLGLCRGCGCGGVTGGSNRSDTWR